MRKTKKIAEFVRGISYSDLAEEVRDRLRRRLLDSIGIALGAIGEKPVNSVLETIRDLNTDGMCTLWGEPEAHTASPVQATMYNTSLTRYLDFMDSYLAPGETPHPSDNIASIIACGETNGCSGKELLTGIGVAYEVQGALAWAAPVRDRGWDHVTHTVISAAAGAAKMLDLSVEETMNALGIAATAHNALRVTRTGEINMWKGIASANAARNGVYSALLARNGMEGPTNVFEGQKGWEQVISGDFSLELTSCEHVLKVMAKKYIAETYAQSAIEGIIELVQQEELVPEEIQNIHLQTFHGAWLIIGGGEGSRYEVETRAQADHSLPYMLAVAALDGTVMDEQYHPETIRRKAVQRLLKNVTVEEDPDLTERFEEGEMPARIRVEMNNGTEYGIEKSEFRGHPNNPMNWDEIEEKFNQITKDKLTVARRDRVSKCVREIENHEITDLTELLYSLNE